MAARAYFCRSMYGSNRSSFAHEIMIPMTIIANGNAETTMIDCKPPSASSPPARRREPATKLSNAPHRMVTHRVGFGIPRWLIEPITIEAESAEVTKKMTIDAIATIEVIMPSGRLPKTSNNMSSGEPEPEMFFPRDSIHIDVPPKMLNHVKHTIEGTTMTTVTNSRRVRPREILAMNRPTKVVHETHHAQ